MNELKSIIKQRTYEKKYYVGLTYRYGRVGYLQTIKINNIEDSPMETAKLLYEEVSLPDTVIAETSKFNRELKIDETIVIDENKYTIREVEHNVDGSLIYYVRGNKYIENEESKAEAEKFLELRDAYVKGFKKQAALSSAESVPCSEPAIDKDKKKWYQFG